MRVMLFCFLGHNYVFISEMWILGFKKMSKS